MKTESRTRTAGPLTRPGGRKPGTSWRSGPGICDSNWAISSSHSRCAPPSLPPPWQKRQRPEPRSHRCRATARLLLPCRGRKAASLERTSRSTPTGRCSAQRAKRCALRSTAGKPMAVCACSTVPESATVAIAPCAPSVSGMGRPRSNHGESVCCSIRSPLALRRSGFARLESPRTSARLSGAGACPAGGHWMRSATNCHVARGGDPFPLTLTLFGVPNDFARQLGLMVGG